MLLNEGKPEFEGQTEDLNESAFVLHVMNPDGTGLHQITYNQSHDVDATVLNNGRVMWSRWDHANGNSGIHLYTSNPDGTDVQLLYGRGSHDTVSTNPDGSETCPAGEDCTVQFVKTREMPNGQLLALVRPFTDADFGGNLADHRCEALRREQPGLPRHGQQRRLFHHRVCRTGGDPESGADRGRHHHGHCR